MAARLPLYERYMRDEEREDDARNWRDAKPGRSLADEPHSLLDSWPFLIPFGLMCVGVLVARAWGWI